MANQTILSSDTKLKCHHCGARACVEINFGMEKETGYVDTVELCEKCLDKLAEIESRHHIGDY
jgi:hydrogenase maturation factor HypF (carbamoyltransferase family)